MGILMFNVMYSELWGWGYPKPTDRCVASPKGLVRDFSLFDSPWWLAVVVDILFVSVM